MPVEKLCGGTFLTLLVKAKKKSGRGKAEFNGKEVSVNETSMLVSLMRIMNPQHTVYTGYESLKGYVSRYKRCLVSNGTDFPFSDSSYTMGFHKRVTGSYRMVLESMREYCDTYLDTADADKMQWLCRAIRELLLFDPDISEETAFYAHIDGYPVCCKELLEEAELCLPAFLVGIWDYIVNQVKDNTAGKATIESWLKKKEYQNSLNEISNLIGNRTDKKLTVIVDIPEISMENTEGVQEKPYSETAIPAQTMVVQKDGQKQRVSYSDAEQASVPPYIPQAIPGSYPAQPATNNIYGGINIFGQTGQIHVHQMGSGSGCTMMELSTLSREFYNLFVTDGECYDNSCFSMPCDQSLNAFIDPEVRNRFLRMSDAEISQVIRMPSLFMTANRERNHADDYQMAIVGRLTDVHLQNSNVKLYWKPYFVFPQQILNENPETFGIMKARFDNELSMEHWTIKHIPLVDALRKTGISPYRMML